MKTYYHPRKGNAAKNGTLGKGEKYCRLQIYEAKERSEEKRMVVEFFCLFLRFVPLPYSPGVAV
jgi:hypothetical protein